MIFFKLRINEQVLKIRKKFWMKNEAHVRKKKLLRIYIIDEYFLKFLKAAVSSNSPLISSGYGSPFTRVNGFISRKLKSRSVENLSHSRVKCYYFAFFKEKLSESIWTYVRKIYENSYGIILWLDKWHIYVPNIISRIFMRPWLHQQILYLEIHWIHPLWSHQSFLESGKIQMVQ